MSAGQQTIYRTTIAQLAPAARVDEFAWLIDCLVGRFSRRPKEQHRLAV
jgi:hypothetical protein